MNDFVKIFEQLSPEKRELLEKRLLADPRQYNIYPLSFSQKRLWFLDQLEPGSTTFNIPAAVKLKGNLNIDILKKSITKIIERHEILRTSIFTIADSPFQIINDSTEVEIEELDFSSLELETKEQTLRSLLNKNCNIYFNLTKNPLFKILLLKLSHNEYVLQIVMHHIISDGWSVNIFIKELSEIYFNYLNHIELTLPPLELQYIDFANWQNDWIKTQSYKKLIEFWKKNLENGSPSLKLPIDNYLLNTNPEQNQVIYKFPSETNAKIQNILSESNSTLFMFFAAVIYILLNKYSGQNDISIGTPIANRNNNNIQNIIGFFVNIIVLRGKVNSQITFIEFLEDVRKISLDAYENQEMPFELLVEEIQPERNLQKTPLFNVMYSFINKSDSKLNLPELELSKVEFDFKSTQYDLTFNISQDEQNNISIILEFNDKLFGISVVNRIVENTVSLAEDLINNPNKKICEIELLCESDLKILSELDKENETTEFISVVDKFENCVNKFPEKIAVEHNNNYLTYKELNIKSNILANYILNNLKTTNSIIGVFVENSIEYVTTILAILKSGNSFLPIDVNYPLERINKFIELSKINLIFTKDKYKEKLSEVNLSIISIETLANSLKNKHEKNINIEIIPRNYAYCIFTSGSTGIPKGVIVDHGNLSNFLFGATYKYEIKNDDIFLQFASNSFDTSIEEIFLAFVNGVTLVIKNDEMLSSLEKFMQVLESKKITILDLPTAYFSQLSKQMIEEEVKFPKTLRKIILGGEKLEQNVFTNWQNKFGHNLNLFNSYGPTETTVIAAAWKYQANSNFNNDIPIGKTILGYSVYIVDNHLNRVPVGAIGELCIGGLSVASAYIDDPFTSALKYIPNPFSRINGSRLFKTGDLVKVGNDGNIVFVGRNDNQVKIRGFRVELEEIEKVLKKYKNIKDCKVIVDKVSVIDHKINVYLISSTNLKYEIDDLRKYVKEKLPKYMLPSRYYQIDEFPLSINGKVDNEKLIKNGKEITSENINKQELTAHQEKVLSVIKKVLSLEVISLSDNFFEIGGHSLLATQLTGTIRKEFKIDFPVKYIFEAVDILDISNKIEDYDLGKNIFIKIPVSEQRDNFPLSFSQQRLWFLDQIEPGSAFYNIPIALKINGIFNTELLEFSINQVIKRHEILRTTFENHEGKPIQKVHPSFDAKLSFREILNEEESDKKEIIKNILIEEISNGFDLNKLPLFRIVCVKSNSNEFILIMNIHHIVSDGWSSNLFVKEIIYFYNSNQNERKVSLPELQIQYGDYSKWQRNWLIGNTLAEKINFWKSYLNDYPNILNLPLDFKRPDIQTYNGGIIQKHVSGNNYEAIKRIIAGSNATSFMFFLTAFYILLYRLTNQEKILIGTPIANRENPEIQDLIGLFVNTIVIAGNMEANPKFSDLLIRIKKSSLDAFQHKELPFEKILDSVNVERNVTLSPLFQVMFTFNHFEKSQNQIDNLNIEELSFDSNTSKFDLSLTVQETEHQNYNIGFEFNSDLFKEETINLWLQYYSNLVNEISLNSNCRILEYKIQTIIENNYNNSQKSEYKDIITRLKELANSKGNKKALYYNGIDISYNQLDKYSDLLANHLLSKGVGNNNLVGVFLDRGIETIISLISILKINAAFVPLDTKYPQDRLEFILNNAEIRFVICSNENKDKIADNINKIEFNNFNELTKTDYSQIRQNYITESLESAYIIYTSGTSGKPKGVVVSRFNLNSFINSAVNDYHFTDSDSILQFASLSFDTCLEEIFPILFAGGKVVLRNDEMLSDNNIFLNAIAKEKITILDLPTAYWHQLTNDMISKQLKYHDDLHTIIIGGEKASKEIYLKWFNKYGDKVKLLNTYGPTETTVVASMWSSLDNNIGYFNELPIGKNLSNSEMYILDIELKKVPLGIVGELFIGGDGVASYYLKDRILTSQKFIPNPYSKKVGERLYKTGDLVRMLPSGNIEFIGRNDYQIKIRGFRVELTEIENVINSLDFIRESVVVKALENEHDVIVCYYTSENKSEFNYQDFTASIKGKLPDFMIPNNFIKIEKIPLTISGKYDRKKLQKKKIIHSTKLKDIILPESEKEIILLGIWKEVLGKDNIGITDNFFELGGDSIIGIQIISKARQNGIVIKPVNIFQYQTIRELAAISSEEEIIFADQGLVNGKYTAIPIQQIFIDNEFKNPNHWNQSLLFKIDKNLNVEKLKETVKKILEHHDALRTRLDLTNKYKLEIIENIDEKSFEHYNLRNIDNPKQYIETECLRLQSSLDIIKGPIFKIAYFDLNENESRILFIVHHIAVDALSWRILLEDFQNIYSSLSIENEAVLFRKTNSFIDWANKLSAYGISDELKNEYEYWENLAQNYEMPFNIDNLNSNLEKYSEDINIYFDSDNTNKLLNEVNKKFSIKISEILLTAILRSYSNLTGKRKLSVFMEGHGRDNSFKNIDISRTIGWFTVIYPIVLDLKKSVNIDDIILSIKEQIISVPNEGFGFGILRYLSNNSEYKNTLKVFDYAGITFNYLGQLDSAVIKSTMLSVADEYKGIERDLNNKRDSLIDITASIVNGCLNVNFNYCPILFEKDIINKWSELLKKSIQEIIDHSLTNNNKIVSKSDFKLIDINDKKLNKALDKLKKK